MKKLFLNYVWQSFGIRRVGIFLAILSVAIGGLWFGRNSQAASPASGNINATDVSVTWTGNSPGVPPAANGEPSCTTGDATATNCDVYTLTVNGNPTDWAGRNIRIRFNWNLVSTDYDMAVYKQTNSVAGFQGDGLMPSPMVDSTVGTSGRGTGTEEEFVISPATSGTGVYYIRAIYFAPNAADQYVGTATVFSVSTNFPTSSCALPTFDNYQPPVGYPQRNNSPEPSVGVNWNTGNVLSMSRLRCNRTTFSDVTSPANPTTGTTWYSTTSPLIATGLDPILFTDPVTGRTICGELVAAGGATDGGISDDDLNTFTATFQTGGPSQGADHQTIGDGLPKP